MIHPDTQLSFINDVIGYGIVATAFIPKGTVVFAKDALDIEVTPSRFNALPPSLKAQVDKYSYIDENGLRIVSWDHAKFVNHSCDCNTMSTGYGFEIAIRDINAGDEITDEYGLFNCDEVVPLSCNCANCREFLYPDDLEAYHSIWDRRVKMALAELNAVAQPLWHLVDEHTQAKVTGYLCGTADYCSVLGLRAKDRLAVSG